MMEATIRARPRGLHELTEILSDQESDHPTRLLRLQGWRDQELDQAVAAGNAHRFAPGYCAIGATVVAITGSWILAAILMSTAVIGVFARNHPVEAIYNALAKDSCRTPIPPNRAAKRLGCAIGTAFLGASAITLAVGATLTGQVLAGAFAAVAWFVTATNVCVPSVIYVTLFGAARSTGRRLI